ncbi:MAG: phosphoribosylanthranilate isomerase [Gammaproteobacteria bacterium]
MRSRIKICGVTRSEDALAAAEAGADAIGLMFFEQSTRYIDPTVAAHVVHDLPAFLTVVGVFVDPSESFVREVLAQVRLSILQFHGDESAEHCERFNLPYIKAISMKESVDVARVGAAHPHAAAFLLDTFSPSQVGGSGKTFDWERANVRLPAPVLLAGGLTSVNVGQALTRTGAWGVDVSSGVESSPGIKNAGKIHSFCDAVRLWDQTRQIAEPNP